jgi:hypothetical protein
MQRDVLVAGHRYLVPTLIALGDLMVNSAEVEEPRSVRAEFVQVAYFCRNFSPREP